jgi:hypothetical protein
MVDVLNKCLACLKGSAAYLCFVSMTNAIYISMVILQVKPEVFKKLFTFMISWLLFDLDRQ